LSYFIPLKLTTNKLESKQVVKTFVREAEYLHSLTIGSETLYTTAGHPFLTEKGYVDAEELGVGTSLVTRAGPGTSSLSSLVGASPVWGGASVSGNLRYNPEQVFFGQRGDAGYTVYNFEVEDNHNYFVGKTNGGICVHNASSNQYFEAKRSATSIGGRQVRYTTEVKATVRPIDIGAGTATNASSRTYVRRLGRFNDDAGHWVGNNLGGGGGVRDRNLFAQNFSVNRGIYNQFEQQIASEVTASGNTAVVWIRGVFRPGATRPHGIIYKYRLDGRTTTRYFLNP
jgi:hypothetical protein